MVSKSWSYTLNNYTDEDCEKFKLLECNFHRCGKEMSKSGTPHLQGIIIFSKATRASALKKICGKTHWEITKSQEHSINYCTKEANFINIDKRTQGKRTDLEGAIKVLKDKGVQGVAEECPEVFVKYYRGFEALQFRLQKNKIMDFVTEVHVIWGKSRSGKSRKVRELCPLVFNVPRPNTGSVWMDGYDGEEGILLDDFYGWIDYDTLLQWTDRYPLTAAIKGGFVHRRWTKVYITSNKPPEKWYIRDEIEALRNRFTSVTKL